MSSVINSAVTMNAPKVERAEERIYIKIETSDYRSYVHVGLTTMEALGLLRDLKSALADGGTDV